MVNLLLSLLGTYALICFAAWVLHRYFLYMPDKTRYAPREVGLSGVEEISFKGKGRDAHRLVQAGAARQANASLFHRQ